MIKKHWPLFIFLLTLFFGLFYKIVFNIKPFYDWDESLYVQTGREMFSRNYFLFPVWQGKIWFDKPPLVPFLYGLVAKIFFFVPPEISTRLFTVIIAMVVLTFIYILYLKVVKNSLITTLIVALTATTPIFLQRMQVVNLDVFLLFGWLGYIIFYNQFWLGLFFLFIAVFSKSLIGFYAPFILFTYYLYVFIRKEINLKQLKKVLAKISLQSVLMLSWFGIMYLIYGNIFWKMQVVESHFRRVTSSIEFHFGERLFYVNLIKDQMGIFFYFSIIGLLIIAFQFFRNKLSSKTILYSLYLLPWFAFLNGTKTKIFWYLFAAIPQFAFLAFYPLSLLKNKKTIINFLIIVFLIAIFYQAIYKNNFFSTFYAQYDDSYFLAASAKKNCRNLNILIDKKTRNDFATLDKLGLLITTTKWWGNHPAIYYYFGKTTNFIFDKQRFVDQMNKLGKRSCVAIYDEDFDINTQSFRLIKGFSEVHLYQKIN